MLKLILRRVLISIPLLFVVSIITFVLEAFIPGNAARTLLGVNSTPAQYEAVRQALHLNLPLIEQYGLYLKAVFHGNLGTSIFTGEGVLATLMQRLPVSLSIIILSTSLSAVVGILAGVKSATGGRVSRKVMDLLTPIGFALPNFWIALVLSATFAVAVPIFPATGYTNFTDSPSAWLRGLVLPVVALAIAGTAMIAKVTRDGMMSALSQEYVRTLRACGVPNSSLVWRHALRNSGTRIATIVGVVFIGSLSGTVLVEAVFVLPGLGSLAVSATNSHDIPVVQGIALAFTVVVVLVNLLVDIAYGLIDPRVRVA